MTFSSLGDAFLQVMEGLYNITIGDPKFYQASQTLVPTGTVQAYLGASAPVGWLKADGSSYSTSQYPNLFALIGTTYGGGSGFFNVPNLQAAFLRGAGSQVVSGTSYSATLGATQADLIKAHNHAAPFVEPISGGTYNIAVTPGVNAGGNTNLSQGNNYGGNVPYAGGITAAGAAAGLTNFGGAETRPMNFAVTYIIAT